MRALEARTLVMRIPKIKGSEDKGSVGESSEDEDENSPRRQRFHRRRKWEGSDSDSSLRFEKEMSSKGKVQGRKKAQGKVDD